MKRCESLGETAVLLLNSLGLQGEIGNPRDAIGQESGEHTRYSMARPLWELLHVLWFLSCSDYMEMVVSAQAG